MKFKIQAGAEIDIPSRKEISDDMNAAFTSWIAEVAQGDRYRRVTMYGTAAAGTGAITLGDTAGQEIVCPPGFVWAVKCLAVPEGYDVTTGTLALSIGSTDASAVVHPDLPLFLSLDANQLVMHGGDKLIVSGTATASARVWVTASVRELPASLAWRLG